VGYVYGERVFHLSGVFMFKRLLVSLLVVFSAVQSFASYDVMNFYTDYKKIIADMYVGLDAIISDEERALCSGTGASPVYGEILYESCAVLIDALRLTEDDVFYDLGSGLGKFITQVYLTSPVKKAWGIEFSENRFARAQKATKNLAKIEAKSFAFENDMRKVFGKEALTKSKNKKFGFTNADMLKADLSDATVIFTCSTCFPPEFMQKLTDKLAQNDGLRILTLVQLPYHKHVHYVTTYVLPMTWSAETPVYSYVVDHAREAKKSETDKTETAQEESVFMTPAPQMVPAQEPEDATLNLDADEQAEEK
jgi:SAM-dependent methyltransferase